MATVEALQALVLQTLDKQNVIENSKDLKLNDQPVEQLALLGALNSLKSKDVRPQKTNPQSFTNAAILICDIDGRLHIH